MYRIQQAVPACVGRRERGPPALEPRRQGRGAGERVGVRARFDPYQAVQQVVAFPGPEPEVLGIDRTPRPAAPRLEHAGAVSSRQGERPLQLGTLEILRAVTLDDADGAGMRGERDRIGQHAVDDEPLVRDEPRQAALRQLALERQAGPLQLPPRRLDRPGGLAPILSGELDYVDAARLERPAHWRRQ